MSDEATDAAGFGLLYFNARWMDPWLGRFAQADSIVPGVGNPQALDRYAYASNSPVRYTDPTGHWILESNRPEEEQRRNAYLRAAVRISGQDRSSPYVEEYYMYAAAYHQAVISERPVDAELGLGFLKSRSDAARMNWWNSEEDANGVVGEVIWANAPDMVGPATIGMAGLFRDAGVPTSTEFDKRLLEWGFSEEDALTVYQEGKRYTTPNGDWVRWDPKTHIAIPVDPYDGTAITIFYQDQKPRGWLPGWFDPSLGIGR